MLVLNVLHWLLAAYGVWTLGTHADRRFVKRQLERDAERLKRDASERIKEIRERHPLPREKPNQYCGMMGCPIGKPHSHVIDFCRRMNENKKKG